MHEKNSRNHDKLLQSRTWTSEIRQNDAAAKTGGNWATKWSHASRTARRNFDTPSLRRGEGLEAPVSWRKVAKYVVCKADKMWNGRSWGRGSGLVEKETNTFSAG